MLALVSLLALAQVSSPVGEGVCIPIFGTIGSTAREMVGESVEGVGAYCSLSGCRMTGQLFNAKAGATPSFLWGTANGSYGALTPTELCLGGFSTVTNSCASAVRIRWNPNQLNITNVTGGADITLLGTTTTVTGSAVVTTNFETSGTGWWASSGDTAANLFAKAPSAGYGAVEYDDTSKGFRAYENDTSWNVVLTSNTDGGFAHGGISGAGTQFQYVHVGDFFINGVAAEGVNMVRNTHAVGATMNACKLGWTVTQTICWWETAGTGGGANVIVEMTDGTTTVSQTEGLCTTAAFTTLDVSGGSANNALVAGPINMQIKNTTNCTVNPANIHCGLDMYCIY